MKVCRQAVRSLDDMIDDPKGFVQSVSDADWAVLGASEPKLQSFTELKKQSYLSPIQETSKAKAFTSKSPSKTNKKRRADSEDEEESEDDEDHGDEYDDEDAQESEDEGDEGFLGSGAGSSAKYDHQCDAEEEDDQHSAAKLSASDAEIARRHP